MIKINNVNPVVQKYSNGEVRYLSIDALFKMRYTITTPSDTPVIFQLAYESNEDLYNLMLMKKALDDTKYRNYHTILAAKFFPYEQADRPMGDQLFTLKYAAKLINDLKFDEVYVEDPHSSVLIGLVDNIVCEYPVIRYAIENVKSPVSQNAKYDVLFFPDYGAKKKYTELLDEQNFKCKWTHGEKVRDLDTAQIIEYKVHNPDIVKGKSVLIIDDMCKGGRTFKEASKALYAAGAANVGLFVNHMFKEGLDFVAASEEDFNLTVDWANSCYVNHE